MAKPVILADALMRQAFVGQQQRVPDRGAEQATLETGLTIPHHEARQASAKVGRNHITIAGHLAARAVESAAVDERGKRPALGTGHATGTPRASPTAKPTRSPMIRSRGVGVVMVGFHSVQRGSQPVAD